MRDSTAPEPRPRLPRIAVVAASLDILGGQGVQATALERALRAEGTEVRFIPINPRFPAGLGGGCGDGRGRVRRSHG